MIIKSKVANIVMLDTVQASNLLKLGEVLSSHCLLQMFTYDEREACEWIGT